MGLSHGMRRPPFIESVTECHETEKRAASVKKKICVCARERVKDLYKRERSRVRREGKGEGEIWIS